MNTNYCNVCGKELTVAETFHYDGRCENCYKNSHEYNGNPDVVKIIEKIRQLAQDWAQEAMWCEKEYRENKDNKYNTKAEVWDLASEYLLNFAADLEYDFLP